MLRASNKVEGIKAWGSNQKQQGNSWTQSFTITHHCKPYLLSKYIHCQKLTLLWSLRLSSLKPYTAHLTKLGKHSSYSKDQMGSFQKPNGMGSSALLETSCGYLLQELQVSFSAGNLILCDEPIYLIRKIWYMSSRLYGTK